MRQNCEKWHNTCQFIPNLKKETEELKKRIPNIPGRKTRQKLREQVENDEKKIIKMEGCLIQFKEIDSEYRRIESDILEKLKPLRLEYDHQMYILNCRDKKNETKKISAPLLHMFIVMLSNHESDIVDIIYNMVKTEFTPYKGRQFRVALDTWYLSPMEYEYGSPLKWIIKYNIMEYALTYTTKLLEKSEKYVKRTRKKIEKYRYLNMGPHTPWALPYGSMEEYQEGVRQCNNHILHVLNPLRELKFQLETMKDIDI